METVSAWLSNLQMTLQQPGYWWQLLCLVVATGLATVINRRLQQVIAAQSKQDSGFRHIAVRSLQRLLWPVSSLAFLLPAMALLRRHGLPVSLLDIAIPILLALAIIRLSFYILRKAFPVSPLLKSSENVLAAIVWLGVVLHLAGWLSPVLQMMDHLAFTLGDTRVSVLSILKLLLIILLAFSLAVWLSELISRRMRRSTSISPSMQVGLSKFSKFMLITIAFLLSLNAVGINLSSLAVFGGALGVGLGFGLQRIASNFISGFILVFDRSIKPGDIITVGDSFGWVEQLNARYLVVRNRDGVDTLIPNENMITSEVINWSYADRNVRLTVKVGISYNDDPEQAMALMLDCAFASPRVLHEPQPAVRLMEFGDSSIELQLRVWLADMENGTAEVKSAINLAIWRAFKANHITIPYPQRDLHIKGSVLPVPASSD